MSARRPSLELRLAVAYAAVAALWLLLAELVLWKLPAGAPRMLSGLALVAATALVLGAYLRARRGYSSRAGPGNGTGPAAWSQEVERLLGDPQDALDRIEDYARFLAENPHPVLRVARDGTVLAANDAATSILGLQDPGLTETSSSSVNRLLRRAARTDTQMEAEVTVRRRHYHFSIVPVAGQPYVNLYGEDITARRRSERLGALVRRLNEGVIADKPLDALLAGFCTDAARALDLSLMWAGSPGEHGQVRSLASAGSARRFVEELEAGLRGGPAAEEDPVMGTLRDRRAIVASVGDPAFEPWRERALLHGIREVAFFPVLADGVVVGVLAGGASRPGSFGPELAGLLEDAVQGLAVAWMSVINRDRLKRQDAALSSAANAVVITDPEGHIEWGNEAFERMTGWPIAEVLGQTPALLKSGEHGNEHYRELWETLASGKPYRGEFINRRRDGSHYHASQTITPVLDGSGRITHFVSIQEDITARKKTEAQLIHLAGHDPLTGLPNRALFRRRVEQAIATADRSQRSFALLFIDLDNFKLVNDTAGHAAGDGLLVGVAERLEHSLRGGDTLGRLGGDEFAILQPDLGHPNESADLARRLLAAMSEPVRVEDRSFITSVSIGITVFPNDGSTVDELLQTADLAMYRAKQDGRDTFRFFAPSMHSRALRRADIETGLREALEHDRLVVHYQPMVELAGGRLVGVEALVRWQDPGRGLRPPDEFIPVAESAGLIRPIGLRVLELACRQTARWVTEERFQGRLAVNLSMAQFQDPALVDEIESVLAATGLPAHCLDLEITESMLARNPIQAVEITGRLREIGVALSLDAFGTGYSSLSRLREFHLDHIKIDRSFVSDIGRAEDAEAIVRATIGLAHSLRLKVVAGGVETQAQARFLRACKCDEAQGYLFARPVSAGELSERLSGDLAGHSQRTQGSSPPAR